MDSFDLCQVVGNFDQMLITYHPNFDCFEKFEVCMVINSAKNERSLEILEKLTLLSLIVE